jgi:hypothetical protein
MLPMARRVVWVIRLTRGPRLSCQLLQVNALEKLYDGMLGGAGGGLAGAAATACSQPPRGTRRSQQHEHRHHQWQGKLPSTGHMH